MGVVVKYSIKELETLTGIRAATLRMWEKRYEIIKPLRTDTNIRYYDNKQLKALLNINILNRNGIKISHIANLTPEEIANKVKDLSFVQGGYDDLFDGLTLSMIDLNEEVFQQTFYKAVTKLGFEETINGLIFPFFNRVGIMWQVGTINPAQEHFMSNMVRQKIIAAVDSLVAQPASNAKTVLLFLPENELHELGLLFFNYLLKSKGYKTVYLGQAVPLINVSKTIGITQPDIVVCHISNTLAFGELSSFIQRLKATTADLPFFVASNVLHNAQPTLPSNFRLFDNLKSLSLQF